METETEGVLILRPLVWLVHLVGLRTLTTLSLLLVVLGSTAVEIARVARELDPILLLSVTVFGILTGWVLAKSPLPGWLAGILACGLGVEGIFLRVGRLGGALVSLLWTLVDLAWGLVYWWLWDGPPDGTPVLSALGELWAGIGTLLTRMRDWSWSLAAGRSAFDPVAAALVWSLVFWAVATWAGWAVRRRYQPLHAVVPAGALLAVSFYYVGGRSSVLLLLLGATLLLMPLVGHHAREHQWEVAGIDFSLAIRGDLAMVAIPLAMALVAMAAVVPSVSVRQIVDFVQGLTRSQAVARGEPIANSLGLEQQPAPPNAFDAARSPGLPRSHLLGSGPELSRQVVMVISTGDIPPGPPQFVLAHSLPPRYYWLGYTYDFYTGRGWRTDGTQTINYGAGEPAVFGDRSRAEFDRQYGREVPMTLPGHRTVRQAVRIVGDVGGLLYVAGNLVTADQNYSVAWRPPADAFGANIGATTYRADSLVPAVSEKELRSAGSDYPEWVRNRYLTLPDEVPARVKSLALDLTATAPTPYDRARAIETYLRTFTYTLDVPAPPSSQDVADYFLFDLKKGYCDYYATAMVVLARAAGLPARLAMGYASGDYDIFNARYIVTEADAHSWPEIYFPGYDWIEFEPTAGLPPIRRPAETAPLVFSGPGETLEPLVARRAWLGWLQRLGLPGGLTLLIVGGVVWAIADGWRLRRLPPDAAAAMLYQRLYHHGRWLDVPVRVGDTPYEFAASLTERLTDLAQERRWGKLLTPAIQEVLYLTDLYVQVCYSPHQPDAADRVEAIHAWQRLRRRLWLARV